MNLKPFCSTDKSRPYLLRPFSRGVYSYATNGHIAVRVPRREDVPEAETEKPPIEKVFEDMPEAGFVPLPAVAFEIEEEEDCEDCQGRGYVHDCPTCECQCSTCSGSGIQPPWHDVTVGIGETIFAGHYIAMLQSLPNVSLTQPCKEISKKWKAAFFRFDGGDGLLMPRTEKKSKHIVANTEIPT